MSARERVHGFLISGYVACGVGLFEHDHAGSGTCGTEDGDGCKGHSRAAEVYEHPPDQFSQQRGRATFFLCRDPRPHLPLECGWKLRLGRMLPQQSMKFVVVHG